MKSFTAAQLTSRIEEHNMGLSASVSDFAHIPRNPQRLFVKCFVSLAQGMNLDLNQPLPFLHFSFFLALVSK
jgi:hypothetical protein